MVIHQPRYEIFESLDNLLLLAPGGRTVYEGEIQSVVPYFVEVLHASINHDRNPADSLMDNITLDGQRFADEWKLTSEKQRILSNQDITKLPSVNNIPSPQSSGLTAIALSPTSITSSQAVIQLDNQNTSPAVISSKRNASFFYQIYLAHIRGLKQQFAMAELLLIELFVTSLLAAVFALGANGRYRGNIIQPFTAISPASLEDVAQIGLYISLALSLASTAAAVALWGPQVPVYWREAASGHSRLAFFIGASSSYVYRIFISSFHFACFYFLVIAPIFSFGSFFGVIFPLVFVWYQWSAFTVWFFDRRTAAIIAVIGGIIWSVLCGLITNIPTGVKAISAAYWATEAIYGKATSPYLLTMNVLGRSAPIFGYTIDRYNTDIGLELVVGFAWFSLAFLSMTLRHRSKQR
jgi:hypothetical protein